jgi:hypothetical protein
MRAAGTSDFLFFLKNKNKKSRQEPRERSLYSSIEDT